MPGNTSRSNAADSRPLVREKVGEQLSARRKLKFRSKSEHVLKHSALESAAGGPPGHLHRPSTLESSAASSATPTHRARVGTSVHVQSCSEPCSGTARAGRIAGVALLNTRSPLCTPVSASSDGRRRSCWQSGLRRDSDSVLLESFGTIRGTAPGRLAAVPLATVGRGTCIPYTLMSPPLYN